MNTPKTYIPANAIRALVRRWESEVKLLPQDSPERNQFRQCIRDLIMVYDGNVVDLSHDLKD